jgi:XTP/dITP diphosphohydrolase
MRLVMASANPHKVEEISNILVGYRIDQRPKGLADIEENAETLEGNAHLKATAVCNFAKDAAVADDTGLEVDYLDGLPGVRSARFAGEGATDIDNLMKLLKALEGVPEDQRKARFRTVAMVVFPDKSVLRAQGVAEGFISKSPRGEKGFGYDSIFVPVEGDGRSFAEMAPGEKQLISGRAFRQLALSLSAKS